MPCTATATTLNTVSNPSVDMMQKVKIAYSNLTDICIIQILGLKICLKRDSAILK